MIVNNKRKKEKWERPKLIVLARIKAEEMSLTSCKAGETFGLIGPGDTSWLRCVTGCFGGWCSTFTST